MITLPVLAKNLKEYFFTKHGNNTIAGHIFVDVANAYDLGSVDKPLRNVYAQNIGGGGGGGSGYLVAVQSGDTPDYLNNKIVTNSTMLKTIIGTGNQQLRLEVNSTLFLLRDGSNSLTGNLAVASGVTIDGVDLSVHVANPDAHHNRASGNYGISVTNQVIDVMLSANPGLTFDGNKNLLLGTPSTSGSDTSNSVTGATHVHAIEAYSDYSGHTNKLIKFGASGDIGLAFLTTGYVKSYTGNSLFLYSGSTPVLELISPKTLPMGNLSQLGDYNRKFQYIYGYNGVIENVIQRDFVATIAGHALQTPAMYLASSLASTSTTATFNTTANRFDELLLSTVVNGVAQTERIRIVELVSGFTYTIVRKIAGTGNLVSNSKFDVDLSGWFTLGTIASKTRDTISYTNAIAPSMSVAFNHSVSYGGVATNVNVVAGQPYWLEISLKANNVSDLQVGVSGAGLSTVFQHFTGTFPFARHVYSFTPTSTGTLQVQVFSDQTASGNYWVDEVIVEAQASTAYDFGPFTNVYNLYANSGTGYAEMTANQSLLGESGPIYGVYERNQLYAPHKMTVGIGNLNGLVDYASNHYGIAIGSDNHLNASTNYSGLTDDNAQGLRIFNPSITNYSTGTLLSRFSTNGLQYATGTTASVANAITWYYNTIDTALTSTNLTGYISAYNASSVSKLDIIAGTDTSLSTILILSNGNISDTYIKLVGDGTGLSGILELRGSGSGIIAWNPANNTSLHVDGVGVGIGRNANNAFSAGIYITESLQNAASSQISEISNDISTYKQLLICGNLSAGLSYKQVGVMDRLQIGGTLFNETLNVNGRVYLANVTGASSWGNGGVLYVENGDLKYCGSSGTITVLAVA
jgi:hypothetical protein